jgi:hypothetical protein
MRFSALAGAVVLSVSGSIGCDEKKEPAPAAPAPAVSSAAPKATVASAAPSVSASAAPKHSETCEVEIFGKVNLPQGLKKGQQVIVYVAQDDCLSDNAQILGHVNAGAGDGAIVIEVFPKWGTDITICAGVDEGEGKPTTRYGKAKGTFHAEAEGEVTFADVKIDITQGKPHVFPKDASDVKPSKMPSGAAPAASASAAPSASASAKK